MNFSTDIVWGELEHSRELRDYRFCKRITVDEVKEIIRKMRRGRAVGLDELPVEI